MWTSKFFEKIVTFLFEGISCHIWYQIKAEIKCFLMKPNLKRLLNKQNSYDFLNCLNFENINYFKGEKLYFINFNNF